MGLKKLTVILTSCAQYQIITYFVSGALQDLNKAIQISNSQGKSACQAHTQRGLIRRLKGRFCNK